MSQHPSHAPLALALLMLGLACAHIAHGSHVSSNPANPRTRVSSAHSENQKSGLPGMNQSVIATLQAAYQRQRLASGASRIASCPV